MQSEILFNNVDWFSVEQNQKQKLTEEIANIESNRLLNTSVDDLCDFFENKYRVDVPILREDEVVADQHETKIDVSDDYGRHITDRSQPFYISGTAIEITITFDGEAEVFKIQPSTFTSSPPRGTIQGNSLILHIEGTDLNPEHVRGEIDRTISEIRSYLDNLRNNAKGLNSQLPQIARNAIERRRKKLLADQNLVSALGFPLKEREDTPQTYIAPEVRRKIAPTMPPASTVPFKPEPALSDFDYDHILNVIQNMAQVMERSPSAFRSMNEESLRSHFLVQLNGHYEGQATGETFNYDGKTDILIRTEGRNIFIAECKYWDGPKKLIDTIDQLLGYSSWRDTKVAVIIFNQRKNFSKVLEAIPITVKEHLSYKRGLGQESETIFRYVFSHRDDPNRELILTVMAFDVPI